jgi:hypothetical protein
VRRHCWPCPLKECRVTTHERGVRVRESRKEFRESGEFEGGSRSRNAILFCCQTRTGPIPPRGLREQEHGATGHAISVFASRPFVPKMAQWTILTFVRKLTQKLQNIF